MFFLQIRDTASMAVVLKGNLMCHMYSKPYINYTGDLVSSQWETDNNPELSREMIFDF